ncbi:HAD family hydrolase [Streptomyces sp. NPDC050704]|uniref:HAD family hydrolase n=1 Tax=Streptomyces sp. NPDC050704 TaxID=3157219 RepID=UPI003427660F
MSNSITDARIDTDPDPHAFHVLAYTADPDDDFEALLNRSSLGTEGARSLRERTRLDTARDAAGQEWEVPGLRTVMVNSPNDKPVRDLIRRAGVVLFDFDGPICRLFAGHASERVRTDLIDWLAQVGQLALLTPEEQAAASADDILRLVAHRYPGSDLHSDLEKRLTQEELKAVSSAMPTPYADPLIRTWTAVGSRLAITTDVSARTARHYLDGRGMLDCFAPHIYGRTESDHDPYRLRRAMTSMGAGIDATLMISSNPTAAEAARRADIFFLGYGRNKRSERELLEAGATCTMSSLDLVLRILRDHE